MSRCSRAGIRSIVFLSGPRNWTTALKRAVVPRVLMGGMTRWGQAVG